MLETLSAIRRIDEAHTEVSGVLLEVDRIGRDDAAGEHIRTALGFLESAKECLRFAEAEMFLACNVDDVLRKVRTVLMSTSDSPIKRELLRRALETGLEELQTQALLVQRELDDLLTGHGQAVMTEEAGRMLGERL